MAAYLVMKVELLFSIIRYFRIMSFVCKEVAVIQSCVWFKDLCLLKRKINVVPWFETLQVLKVLFP
jgi:hypothetical protein